MSTRSSQGFSIIEIVIACAIFLGTVAAFVTSNELLRDMAENAADKTAAALLIEEGAEAILLLRDLGWDTYVAAVESESPRSLYWDGDSYELSASDVVIDGRYVRRATFFEVRRDGADSISDVGTVDPDTRRVRIEVMTVEPVTTLAVAEMLVHNNED